MSREPVGRLLLGCALIGACGPAAAPDPLDPDHLADLSTSHGDATGSSWSGTYAGEVHTLACDCPTLTIDGEDVDLCAAIAEPREVEVVVSQAGGFVVFEVEGLAEHTGPIDADGGYTVAAVTDLSETFGEAELRSRIDGAFSEAGEELHLAGALLQRLVGELGTEPISCDAEMDLDATRTP